MKKTPRIKHKAFRNYRSGRPYNDNGVNVRHWRFRASLLPTCWWRQRLPVIVDGIVTSWITCTYWPVMQICGQYPAAFFIILTAWTYYRSTRSAVCAPHSSTLQGVIEWCRCHTSAHVLQLGKTSPSGDCFLELWYQNNVRVTSEKAVSFYVW